MIVCEDSILGNTGHGLCTVYNGINYPCYRYKSCYGSEITVNTRNFRPFDSKSFTFFIFKSRFKNYQIKNIRFLSKGTRYIKSKTLFRGNFFSLHASSFELFKRIVDQLKIGIMGHGLHASNVVYLATIGDKSASHRGMEKKKKKKL